MEVPPLLKSLIADGVWPSTPKESFALTMTIGRERVRAMAPEAHRIALYTPPFFTVWQRSASNPFWNSAEGAPDGLDPKRALVIGDFGIGSDAPIVLDGRVGAPPPSVVRLRWGKVHNEWVEMTSSFPKFTMQLGLCR
ncbi:MAG: hypothetical protein AAGE52_14885 [Myxococcota bacterium]